MPEKHAELAAEFVRVLRLLHNAIEDVRGTMGSETLAQMEWRNLNNADRGIATLEARIDGSQHS